MDNGTFIAVYIVMLHIGFAITTFVLLFYSVVAPWYRTAAGRYIWGLLLSLSLVLSVSEVRILFGEFPYRREIALVAFGGFLAAIFAVGVGIYRAQFKSLRHMLKQKCDSICKAGKNGNRS